MKQFKVLDYLVAFDFECDNFYTGGFTIIGWEPDTIQDESIYIESLQMGPFTGVDDDHTH